VVHGGRPSSSYWSGVDGKEVHHAPYSVRAMVLVLKAAGCARQQGGQRTEPKSTVPGL
jgi:hypothetical protein